MKIILETIGEGERKGYQSFTRTIFLLNSEFNVFGRRSNVLGSQIRL